MIERKRKERRERKPMMKVDNFFKNFKETKLYCEYQDEYEKLFTDLEYLKLKEELEKVKKTNDLENYYYIKKNISNKQKNLLSAKNKIIEWMNELLDIVDE